MKIRGYATIAGLMTILLVVVYAMTPTKKSATHSAVSNSANKPDSERFHQSTTEPSLSTKSRKAITQNSKGSLIDRATEGQSKLHKERVRKELRKLSQFAGFTDHDRERAAHILSEYFLKLDEAHEDDEQLASYHEQREIQTEELLDVLHQEMLDEQDWELLQWQQENTPLAL